MDRLIHSVACAIETPPIGPGIQSKPQIVVSLIPDDLPAERLRPNAIAADPENTAPAWNNLAYVLQALGRRREAIEAAEKAVDLGGPDDPNYRSTLDEITNM